VPWVYRYPRLTTRLAPAIVALALVLPSTGAAWFGVAARDREEIDQRTLERRPTVDVASVEEVRAAFSGIP
jgi:hypothetical protein